MSQNTRSATQLSTAVTVATNRNKRASASTEKRRPTNFAQSNAATVDVVPPLFYAQAPTGVVIIRTRTNVQCAVSIQRHCPQVKRKVYRHSKYVMFAPRLPGDCQIDY